MDSEDAVAKLTAELRDLRIRVAQLEASQDRNHEEPTSTVLQEQQRWFSEKVTVSSINKTLKKPALGTTPLHGTNCDTDMTHTDKCGL
jgi:hypothetical protein